MGSALSWQSLTLQEILGLVSNVAPQRSQQLNFSKPIYDQNPVLEPAIYFGLKSKPQATAAPAPHARMETFSQMPTQLGVSNGLFFQASCLLKHLPCLPRIFQGRTSAAGVCLLLHPEAQASCGSEAGPKWCQLTCSCPDSSPAGPRHNSPVGLKNLAFSDTVGTGAGLSAFSCTTLRSRK